MKIAAILLIWLMCSLTGFYKTFLLKKRKEDLDTIIKIIEYFGISADYERKVPREVFTSLPEKQKLPVFREMENTDDVYGAFKKINRNQAYIDENDFLTLDNFFSMLGTVDIENQLSLVKKTLVELEEHKENAQKKYNTYSRLYMTSGILVGSLFVILMI